jgi:hypothetical protein
LNNFDIDFGKFLPEGHRLNKRQQGTTKNNFIEVRLANLLNRSKKTFWQTCQNDI